MYKFKGTEYTAEQLQGVADRKGYTFDELLNKNPEIEKPGKTQPTTQKSAEPVDVIKAPNTESKSEDGSSDFVLSEISTASSTLNEQPQAKKEEQEEEKPFQFWKQTVLSPEYEKAFEQLSKDTGEYSSVKGDGGFYSGVKNIGEYIKQLGKAVYQPMLTEEETTYDPINIDLLTRVQVAKELSPRQLDKLKKGGYTLKEKEDLLKKSKSKVIKNALNVFQKNINNEFNVLDQEQKIFEERLVSIFGETVPTSDSFVTQAGVDLYNNLNQRLNDISKQKQEAYNKYKASTEELEAEYSFNLASGVIDNSFKLTDDIEEFNKGVKENLGTDLSARLVGGLWKTVGDIVTFPGALMGMAGDFFTDQDAYSSYDAFQDVLYNLTNYNTLGDPGEAEVLDKEGKYVSDPKQYVRMTADMLPFTLGIIGSAARGNTKGIQQSLSKAFPKRGIDKKLAQDISMGNAAFAMTFQDNVKEGEKEGLSRGQAIAYGSAKSLGTALSQAVMPDANFLKSAKGLTTLNSFKGSLKSAANKKALSKASTQFFTNIGKELGEEEIEFVFDKANKISFGLALGDLNGIVREQKQLFAGTLMLSGGLGSFGATATGKAVKKQVYDGIIKNQQVLLNTLQKQRIKAEKSGNVNNAKQLREAEIFATDLIRASKISPENVTMEQLDLVVEKQKLINKKKKLDSSFHAPINEQIEVINKKIAESKVSQTKEETAAKLKKGVDVLGEKLGFKPKRLKDATKVEEYLNDINPGEDNIKRAGNLGIFVSKPDGTKELIINEDANKKSGVITTEAHEALHFVLYETVKNSPETQKALGNALLSELKKIDTGQVSDSQYLKRLNSYLIDPEISEGDSFEEALTLFSEATLSGDIVYNENVMTKIGDYIRQALQSIGLEQVVFNEGRDVFNFIKDYNNSIKKGRADNFITDAAEKGAVGKLVKSKADGVQAGEQAIKDSKSEKDLYTNTEKTLGITKGTDGKVNWDGFDEVKALSAGYLWRNDVERRLRKYKNFADFDQYKEDIISDVTIGDIKGARGIVDIIRRWNPDLEPNIAKWINGQIDNKILGVVQKRGVGGDFKLDVTEAKGVTDTTTEKATERVDKSKEIEVESLRKKIGIGDEFKPIVFNAVKKTFGTRLPDVSEKDFIKGLQDGFRTELKKPIAKLMGRTEDYRSFLSDNFENIYNALPQSVINRRLNEFAEPVMVNGKQAREKTAEGKKIFKKKKIVKAEWLKYFLGDNVGRSTQGTRKTALAEALSEAFALDATMEVLADPTVFDKLQQIGEITNNPVSDNYIEQISEKIGRPVDMKFAKVVDNKSKENILVKDILGDAFLAADPNKNKNVPFNTLLKNFVRHMAKNYSRDGKPYDAIRYKPILFEYYVGKTISLNNPDLKLINDFKGFDATGAGDLNFVHIPTGEKINIEVKMKATDQMSSGTINYNPDTKEFEKPKNPIEIFSVVAAALKGAGVDTNIDKIFEAAGVESFRKLTFDQADIVNQMKTKLLNPKIILGDVSNIINAYKKKGVHFIVLGDQMYSLSENTFGTGLDKLSGKGFIKARLVWGSKNKKNNTVSGSIRAFNLIEKGTVNKGTNISDVKFKLSQSLDTEFNQLLQATTGVEYYKTFSPAKARLIGRGKGKRKFFIPYSADDFVGLLYATLGEGKVGNKQMAWYEENLLRPFSRGIQQYEVAKQKAMREWMALSSQIKKDVPGGLNKRNDTGFRNQDSLRMYIWAKQGMDVPGAAKSDVSDAVALVSNNPKLKEFAERLIALNPEGYPAPGQSWDAGDITTDIVSYVNDVRRGEFLTEWKQNVDQIFTDKNKQKLLASYGQNYIDALEDILHRMKTGRNRKFGVTKAERAFMDWTNNSVGAIMFFNARSAVLQTLSAVNFINFSDNNPINAGLAFANQPQYWKDFSTLFNSDFLKQRRSGLQTDVNADEIANAAKSSSNKAKAALSAILKLGFTPTQIADSFAIASGGATFYRNRVKKYIKDGLDKEAAEKKAFTDFQEVAEETQQSARPDRISSQQASSLGRLVLAFGNTPMQYARLTKKASLDLINGRGDWKTNISKIAYYSVIQNIIFSSLQQGLFALLFDEEDDEKEKSRYFRIGNSSFDTLLRGAGVYGAAAATVKNMVLEIIEQSEKSRPDYTKVAMEATALSPPINSKLRKLESAGKTFTYKQSKEKVFTEGFSFENPGFLAAGKTISALTNLPADRIVQKADHINTAMQNETELWQAIALSLGWSEWDLNMIEKQSKSDFEKKLKRIEKLLEKY